MRFTRAYCLGTAIAAVLAASHANAEINFNGFMSIGGGMTVDGDQPLYGYDDDVSFEPDTMVGIQASGDLGNGFSATTQLTARSVEGNEVEAEWAYVSYQATPELQINAGRQRMPLYIFSDFLDVGYAYHWVSPPGSFYNAPLSSFNGISLNYTTYLGDWETGLQVVGGSASENDIAASGGTSYDLEFDNYMGAVATVGYGPVTFRATYQHTKQSLEGSLFEGVALAAGAAERVGHSSLAEQLTMEDIDLTFAGVGVSVDWKDILFVAEAREQKYNDNIMPDERAYYASLGYRLGSVMPYVSFERAESSGEDDINDDLRALIGSDALGKFRNSLDENASIYTAGVRYNFHPAAALKVEYTMSDDHRDQSQLSPGFGDDVSLVRVAVDAVF